jgi:5-methylcytosine-specific restriction endonuclease McrA
MQYVFVLDKNKQPLDLCHPARARQLLREKRATIFRRYPFTILLKDRELEESVTHAHQVKLDPGSRTTGIAMVREGDNKVLWAAELAHRGLAIKAALDDRRAIRQGRRNRKCRYRPPRFDNRRRREGWLPPSLESRVANLQTWVRRLAWSAPLESISMELVKFDTQAMQNPEISGVEYQQGNLMGYEIREYLLEKWGRKCAYCGRTEVPLEVEHIVPKGRGGSNRVSNLTLSCHKCNQEKGSRTAAEFGHPKIQAAARQPLKDAAAVNITRWELWRRLSESGLPVHCGTGGKTKYNRTRFDLPKTHWIDAACVGEVDHLYVPSALTPLYIQAMGHGCRQMCRMDKYGFPRTGSKGHRRVFGFKTGDMVSAHVPTGVHAGNYSGRVAIRKSGSFNIKAYDCVMQGISHRYCCLDFRSDGYFYSQKGGAGSFTGLKQVVPAANIR